MQLQVSAASVVSKLPAGYQPFILEVIRGTPVLVQAIWIYFALPLLIGYTLPSVTAGVIVIALNSGAYIAEIVRGAVHSVDKGQMEAGRSLGLSHHHTMMKRYLASSVPTDDSAAWQPVHYQHQRHFIAFSDPGS